MGSNMSICTRRDFSKMGVKGPSGREEWRGMCPGFQEKGQILAT